MQPSAPPLFWALLIHDIVAHQTNQAASEVTARAAGVVANLREAIMVILDCFPNVDVELLKISRARSPHGWRPRLAREQSSRKVIVENRGTGGRLRCTGGWLRRAGGRLWRTGGRLWSAGGRWRCVPTTVEHVVEVLVVLLDTLS